MNHLLNQIHRNSLYNFFQVIAGNAFPRHSFEEDKEVLKMIDNIENGVGGIRDAAV